MSGRAIDKVFRKLSTRLTVLYATLFGAMVLVVSFAVFLAISGTAQHQVRLELAATGVVFDQVSSMRASRLLESTGDVIRDRGFREAVAAGDEAAITRALDIQRRRMGNDLAFMIRTDGRVIGARLSDADRRMLQQAFSASGDPSGVASLAGRPHHIVSVPVLSPELVGWVMFATPLDGGEMAALEGLAAIPLQASVLTRARNGRWSGAPELGEVPYDAATGQLGSGLNSRGSTGLLDLKSGQYVTFARPLKALSPDEVAILLLRYPVSQALAPFRPLLIIGGLLGLIGLAAVSWGSWLLARSLTRPISQLDEAAHRLQRGEDALVEITGNDEIGRLAQSFNAMAAEMRDRERRITHLALHDDDTGLPNRLALEQVVEGFAEWPVGQVYVAALGMDRFSHMRGAIGHKLAAQAVRMVGNRLGGLAPTCGVARISTEVLGFVLVADSDGQAMEDVQRLLDQLEQPVRVAGEAIDVALSVGLASLEGHEVGPAIEKAVTSLDQARAARRKVAIFDPDIYGDPAANLSLMSSLLAGLRDGQLELWHQPKFDMRRRITTGTEVLLRWNHPTRGMIVPEVFIPMAEETGHIRAITEWVVRQTVADQRALAAAGFDVALAVNISGRILGEPDFVDFVEATLKEAVGRICFEITETAVIENPDVALTMLDRFADLGVSISIDDFGAGLSSLAYLKRIRGHELKIDRSIIQDVVGSQRDALIIRSTIDLAHSLGLKVVAEGVETSDQFSLLSAMGCDQAQGYLVARPMPLSELFRFLDEDHDAVSARR